MIKEEILLIKVGNELDNLIAEIFEDRPIQNKSWKELHDYGIQWRYDSGWIRPWYSELSYWILDLDKNKKEKPQYQSIYSFSTKIADTWKVFEKIKLMNRWIEVAWNPKKNNYRCMIGGNLSEGKLKSVDMSGFATAQEAICKVVLIATLV